MFLVFDIIKRNQYFQPQIHYILKEILRESPEKIMTFY